MNSTAKTAHRATGVSAGRILLVDDEPSICWALSEALRDEGFEVETAGSVEHAAQILARTQPDTIVLDVRLPGMDGITAMARWKTDGVSAPIIIMTAFGNLSIAVQAIDRGAYDYLVKPLDLDSAVGVIRNAVQSYRPPASSAGNHHTESSVDQRASSAEELIIGSSPIMQSVYRRIAMVAERSVPVLLTGESGTGKDLVARAIHTHSRRSGEFVPICVPALSENLIESELFGHVRGAFTGADSDRRGLLELAHQGTAFIDEIGDVALPLQVKLLRVLETQDVIPVGGRQPIRSNFRLIAATNRHLPDAVARAQFREDLFYRLNVFPIHLPPLRERMQDIPELAHYFLGRLSPDSSLRFADDVWPYLQSRSWNGNVRELQHAVEAAAVLCRGGILTASHFRAVETAGPLAVTQSAIAANLSDAVREWALQRLKEAPLAEQEQLWERFLAVAEPELLNVAVQACGGNRAMAARLLGMHRETLRDKLRKYSQGSPDEA